MEKPILFNTEMVQAILEGGKTVTRRVIKRTPSNDEPSGYGFWKEFNERDNRWYVKDYTHNCTWWPLKEYIERFSRYHIGDILYVRETWFVGDLLDEDESIKERGLVLYKADKRRDDIDYESIKWRPSIHMPKDGARIFLKVTDVRVERLQDITEEQAINEGCKGERCEHPNYNSEMGCCTDCYNTEYLEPPQLEFSYLWNSTLKKEQLELYGWDNNPWVWVIEFKKVDR